MKQQIKTKVNVVTPNSETCCSKVYQQVQKSAFLTRPVAPIAVQHNPNLTSALGTPPTAEELGED